MGLIRNAIVWPLCIYGILMAHVAFNTFKGPSDGLRVQAFPKDTKTEAREALISNRKPLIKAVFAALQGKGSINEFVTADAELEDPLQKLVGAKAEMAPVISWIGKNMLCGDFKVHAEEHGPHEVVLDYDVTCRFKVLPTWPFTVRTRSRLVLEPPKKAGSAEKLFRYEDEIGGNPLLSEKSIEPAFIAPYLGRMHAELRRFHGFLLAKIVNSGYLG